MRDHTPVVLDTFNGLWKRGVEEEVPLDHFTDCNNIKFIGSKSFGTRDGIDISQLVEVPLENVKRIYNYPTPDGNTLIVLTWDADNSEGNIYHVVDAFTVHGPLLTIEEMTDFAFLPYAGRGYISPFTSFDVGGLNVEKGLEDEFLYVYLGDGTAARKAAGVAPSGNMGIANGAAGHTDAGVHIFGVVFETDSGFLSEPGSLEAFTTSASLSVSFTAVPISGEASVVKRHIVVSKAITGYDGNLTGYDLFFIPGATIPDNITTVLANQSFFDADLLADASHLIDNFAEIPAGAVLTLYHNRLCLAATFDDISVVWVSAPGEPEAINEINGLLVMNLDGNPITNAQELRDVLYTFKRSKTSSFVDNGDVPSSWPQTIIDNALGTSVHGIATVIDSGSASVDFLIICTYQGISLFNGLYASPELSWKIETYWRELDRNEFRKIQILNASIQKEIYIVLPDRTMLMGNYGNGMDPKKMRWTPWSFIMGVNTIAVVNIDEIIFGADIPV